MRNSGASLTVIWADNVPTTRSRRLRWSTRLICGWPIKPVQAARTAPTSSLSPPKRCAKSWLTTPGASEPRNGAAGALKVELDEAAIVSPEQSQAIVDLHEALGGWVRLTQEKPGWLSLNILLGWQSHRKRLRPAAGQCQAANLVCGIDEALLKLL